MFSKSTEWKVLSLPAIAERDETYTIVNLFGTRVFERKTDEALHPDRESLNVYAYIRGEIGDYNFQSQYQQNPAPPGGAIVKTGWFKYHEPGEEPAQFDRTVQSWDTANKSTELADYSVCTTWGVSGKFYFLRHVFREKLNYPDLRRAVLTQAAEFKAGTILIEDKASGTQLIQDLQSGLVNGVIPYKAPPNADKVMRLHAQSAMFENGRVFLPREAPWLADYVQELTTFPGSQYADQVDSTTQFLDYISRDLDLEVYCRFAAVDLSAFFRDFNQGG
jgi:predicted phage terminase large subunit-like protein